jgi:hypothetical protein
MPSTIAAFAVALPGINVCSANMTEPGFRFDCESGQLNSGGSDYLADARFSVK